MTKNKAGNKQLVCFSLKRASHNKFYNTLISVIREETPRMIWNKEFHTRREVLTGDCDKEKEIKKRDMTAIGDPW